MTQPLALPLRGKPNCPIYDANGALVSITEHAEAFVAAMNNQAELLAALEVSRRTLSAVCALEFADGPNGETTREVIDSAIAKVRA